MPTGWQMNRKRMLESIRSFCAVIFWSNWSSGLCCVAFLPFIFFMNSVSGASDLKAQSLKELLGRYDASRCKECHGEIYAQWEKSHHARSIMDIFMEEYLSKGVLSVKNPKDATQKNFPCFQCHFPQLKGATDEVAAEIAAVILSKDRETMKQLNINCLVCHHDMAMVHGLPEQGVLYGSSSTPEHPDEEYKSVRNSPIMSRPIICGQCHGLGPVLEEGRPVQCATLYGSYLHAYIPSGGSKTCQECHMEKADHTCPPNFKDRGDVSRRLAKSLPMDVQAMFYRPQITPGQFANTVVVDVKIGSRAGHRIPDG